MKIIQIAFFLVTLAESIKVQNAYQKTDLVFNLSHSEGYDTTKSPEYFLRSNRSVVRARRVRNAVIIPNKPTIKETNVQVNSSPALVNKEIDKVTTLSNALRPPVAPFTPDDALQQQVEATKGLIIGQKIAEAESNHLISYKEARKTRSSRSCCFTVRNSS